MRVRAKSEMKIRGKNGVVELREGDLFCLQDEAALLLVEEGKVEPVEMPTKIFSRLLGETIMLVETTQAMDNLLLQGATEAIYLPGEITYLKDKDPMTVRACHDTKKVFPGSVVLEGGE